MKLLIVSVLLFLIGCASLAAKNKSIAANCNTAQSDNEVIECFRDAIYYRIRANWWIASKNLTKGDYPQLYRIKIQIQMNPDGTINDVKMHSSSGSIPLDRSVVRGIYQSAPLPVPHETLFMAGGFNSFVLNFVHDDVPPVFGGKTK